MYNKYTPCEVESKVQHIYIYIYPLNSVYFAYKTVPLQARRGPEGSRKLRFPDFVTMAQDGGRLSALNTGRPYSWYSFLLEAESTPGS